MKRILRKLIIVGIFAIVASASVVISLGKPLQETRSSKEPVENSLIAPLSPVYPPEKPTHVNPNNDHPNDMNKGIGRIRWSQPGGVLQIFTTTSNNPEAEEIYYKFFFGDGTNSGWLGPYDSGEIAITTHDFNTIGTFQVSAVALVDGTETDLSPALTVKMFLAGDTNGDGPLDFGDINPFVLILSTGKATYYTTYPNGYYYTGDCNVDGVVDFGDINPFVALLSGGG